jgi:hypothetical protein
MLKKSKGNPEFLLPQRGQEIENRIKVWIGQDEYKDASTPGF